MATYGRIGNNKGYVSSLASIVIGAPTTLNLRKSNVTKALFEDRWYASRPFAVGKGDDISIVLDNDVTSKRFDVTLSRRVSPTGGTYGNSNVAIVDYAGTMFGPTTSAIFPFEDFALVMQPRVKTGLGTTEMLWRWKGFGTNNVSINYGLQNTASSPVSWDIDYTSAAEPIISILLPTDVPDNLTNLTTTSRIAVANIAETSPTTGHDFWILLGYAVATLQSDGTDTTVTITSPAGITLTGTGLTNGDQVYLNVDAGIPWIASNVYSVHTVSGLTFKVSAATGGPQGPTAGGTSDVRFGTSSTSSFAGFQPGNTLVLSSGFGVATIVADAPLQHDVYAPITLGLKVQAKYGNAAAVTVPVMSGPITNLALVNSFRSGDDITALATAVNASTTMPVSAVSIGVGGVIGVATWYNNPNNLAYPLVDGINYVKTTTMTPSGGGYNYTIDFKLPVDPALASYAEWASEEMYLCPMTAANVCSYLNSLAVCGLSANGKAETSSGGSKIQISTATIGSVGSVQVRGGLANTALANVRGAAVETADFAACNVAVPTTQTSGFHAEWPVKISNSNPYIKENDLTNRDLVSIVGNTWTVGWVGAYAAWLVGTTYAINNEVRDGSVVYRSLQNANTGNTPASSPAWWVVITPANATVAYSHEDANGYWQIERHGNYMAMVWANDGILPDLSLAQMGGYVIVSNDGITDTVSIDNEGTFIITAINIASNIIYFENASAVEEDCRATINLVSMDSLMSGDQIVVGSDVWGTANRRTFTVDTVNYVSDGLTPTFTTVETPTAHTYPPILAAGPQSTVQVRSGVLHSFVKTIYSIVPLPEDPTYSIIGLKKDTDDITMSAIGENYGSQLSALDKFAFTVATTIGTDGYAHSVGLIGEADKVMYGYETDPVSYPGVVAAGSNINISGPLVKRIQVGLSLRVRGTTSTVFEAVRGAVATFVNNSKVGESIAISDIISVASSIGGVEAVSVSSPAYTTSADRITVQPYEKALVLQPELDITLTLIG